VRQAQPKQKVHHHNEFPPVGLRPTKSRSRGLPTCTIFLNRIKNPPHRAHAGLLPELLCSIGSPTRPTVLTRVSDPKCAKLSRSKRNIATTNSYQGVSDPQNRAHAGCLPAQYSSIESKTRPTVLTRVSDPKCAKLNRSKKYITTTNSHPWVSDPQTATSFNPLHLRLKIPIKMHHLHNTTQTRHIEPGTRIQIILCTLNHFPFFLQRVTMYIIQLLY